MRMAMVLTMRESYCLVGSFSPLTAYLPIVVCTKGRKDSNEKVTTIWDKRKNKSKHDHSLDAYILNPHLKVIAEAGSTNSLDHDKAVERLIAKLMLPRNLVGNKKKIELARLIDLCWSEYADFTNRLSKFNSDRTWIIAKMDTNLAHEWHKKYSVTRTQVL